MRSVTMSGVRIDDVNDEELARELRRLCTRLDAAPAMIVTPNPEFLLAARANPLFRAVLCQSALALPDGVALRFAAAALCGYSGLHRHTGVDVLPQLAQCAHDHHLTLVLLGGDAFSLPQTVKYFTTLIKGINIIPINPGTIRNEHPELPQHCIDQCIAAGPCVIAVALGQGRGGAQGKQEMVMDQIAATVPNARVIIGVGGAFDIYSGVIMRAPLFFRRIGLEWLWRFLCEPWRFSRIMRAVFVFPIIVAWDTLAQGTFLRSSVMVFREIFLHLIRRSRML